MIEHQLDSLNVHAFLSTAVNALSQMPHHDQLIQWLTAELYCSFKLHQGLNAEFGDGKMQSVV